jgi:uncharacterized Zn finger protein (UPF0148 family)
MATAKALHPVGRCPTCGAPGNWRQQQAQAQAAEVAAQHARIQRTITETKVILADLERRTRKASAPTDQQARWYRGFTEWGW